MAKQKQDIAIDIPQHEILNAEHFEFDRLAAYTFSDPAERRQKLEELARATRLQNGDWLADRAMEVATDPELSKHTEAAKKVGQAVARDAFYRVILNDDGTVKDVQRVLSMPDDPTEDAKRRMAELIGWGPKQNDSSGVLGGPIGKIRA